MFDVALFETPPKKRRKAHKKADDCHLLIRWSQLDKLAKNNFSCSCGEPIKHFERRMIGIATGIDFCFQSCKRSASALADWFAIS
jgi:hypothetical protein